MKQDLSDSSSRDSSSSNKKIIKSRDIIKRRAIKAFTISNHAQNKRQSC